MDPDVAFSPSPFVALGERGWLVLCSDRFLRHLRHSKDSEGISQPEQCNHDFNEKPNWGREGYTECAKQKLEQPDDQHRDQHEYNQAD